MHLSNATHLPNSGTWEKDLVSYNLEDKESQPFMSSANDVAPASDMVDADSIGEPLAAPATKRFRIADVPVCIEGGTIEIKNETGRM